MAVESACRPARARGGREPVAAEASTIFLSHTQAGHAQTETDPRPPPSAPEQAVCHRWETPPGPPPSTEQGGGTARRREAAHAIRSAAHKRRGGDTSTGIARNGGWVQHIVYLVSKRFWPARTAAVKRKNRNRRQWSWKCGCTCPVNPFRMGANPVSIAIVRVRVTVLTYRAGPVSAPVVSTTTAKALRSLCTTI